MVYLLSFLSLGALFYVSYKNLIIYVFIIGRLRSCTLPLLLRLSPSPGLSSAANLSNKPAVVKSGDHAVGFVFNSWYPLLKTCEPNNRASSIGLGAVPSIGLGVGTNPITIDRNWPSALFYFIGHAILRRVPLI